MKGLVRWVLGVPRRSAGREADGAHRSSSLVQKWGNSVSTVKVRQSGRPEVSFCYTCDGQPAGAVVAKEEEGVERRPPECYLVTGKVGPCVAWEERRTEALLA